MADRSSGLVVLIAERLNGGLYLVMAGRWLAFGDLREKEYKERWRVLLL